jgi:hypothetical protein
MKIQTISLCTGDGKCPRRCPYCVSKMTGQVDTKKVTEISSSKVGRGLRLAKMSGVSTALITSKGETLFGTGHNHTLQYLQKLRGVTTVAISIVSEDIDLNREIYGPEYEDPFTIAQRIHEHGMMVRLCCTMFAGGVDTWGRMEQLIATCADQGIEQLSFAPVSKPEICESAKIEDWIETHKLPDDVINDMYDIVKRIGHRLMFLVHGGEVYDVGGVSVCTRYCLTDDTDPNEMRQVIVYPNGEIRYSWTRQAAKLMRGD